MKGGLCAAVFEFDPMYDRLYAMRLKSGERNLISLAEFAAWDNAEWPDPR